MKVTKNGMKIIILSAVTLFAVVVVGIMYVKYQFAHIPDNKNLEITIDTEVDKVLKSGSSYGLVIGVYKDGKTFTKGYGTINRNSAIKPDGTTIFQIGSITKLFTASTYQILSDEKVFTSDATLGDVIGAGYDLSPQSKKVTLRQLATHTSGFPSIPKPLELEFIKLSRGENLTENPYSYLGDSYIYAYLKTAEGKRKPGHFEYSNYGMGLLGHVMERVTKKDYESLVSEKILEPLAMKSTTILLTPKMSDRMAQGYDNKGDPTPVWTFASLAGAGAFNSNAEDMLKFIQANIEASSSSVSQSLIKTHEPQLNGSTAIGWMLPTFFDRFVGNNSILWHNGMVGGYASYISIDTKNKTGVIILSNKSVDVTALGLTLTREVRAHSFKE